jgi:hypothetical protein
VTAIRVSRSRAKFCEAYFAAAAVKPKTLGDPSAGPKREIETKIPNRLFLESLSPQGTYEWIPGWVDVRLEPPAW